MPLDGAGGIRMRSLGRRLDSSTTDGRLWMPTAQTNWQPPTELPDLRRTGIIALDPETSDEGLRADLGPAWPWHGGYVCGVSVAYWADGGIRAHYLPLRHPNTNNLNRPQVFAWLRDLV